MRNNEYDPQQARALYRVDDYKPLASMKARAAGAWIRDTLANAEDKPWTVEPTPLPELSASGKLAARQAFWLDLQRQGVMLSMLPPGIAALPHFSPEAISALLTLYPNGYRGQPANETERRQLEAQGGNSWASGDGQFDVIDFWGRVPGA